MGIPPFSAMIPTVLGQSKTPFPRTLGLQARKRTDFIVSFAYRTVRAYGYATFLAPVLISAHRLTDIQTDIIVSHFRINI